LVFVASLSIKETGKRIYFKISACSGEHSCGDYCINLNKVCDRVHDCDDYSDEADCGNYVVID
jgi:hypothetical protein